jgi:hypothetical protein
LSAIQRTADLLWAWSYHVDEKRAPAGAVERMRRSVEAARTEHARLQKSAGALDALIKTWATRLLERLPRGPAREWLSTGTIPSLLEAELAGLPEPVAALVREHVADDIDRCECCGRRAPLRLLSDQTDSGEGDWRCAWGCLAPAGTDPEPDPLLEWLRGLGI